MFLLLPQGHALGRLVGIAEAEINPLIVKKEGEGVVAVDGLIVQH